VILDTETRESGNAKTGRWGDTGTRGKEDAERARHGDTERKKDAVTRGSGNEKTRR
jgi:hypothetical protein